MGFCCCKDLEEGVVGWVGAQDKGGSAKKGRKHKAGKASKDGGSGRLVPTYDILACEYHSAMVAGLSLIGAHTL